MKLFVLAVFLVPSLVVAEENEVTFVNVPAPDVESIVIEQPQGRLVLNGWDKAEVRVVAHKHAKDGKTLDQLTVDFVMFDGKIRIRSGVRVGDTFRALPASDGAGIDLTISAPRGVALRAGTWAGDLDATGFRAGAVLSSRGGEVHASDIDGELRTETLHGKQRLSSIRGNVEADGVTGDVEIDAIDGEVLEVKVVKGQIVARRIRSPLVRLFSSSGGVVLMGSTRPGARYEITAREGDVRLVLERAPFTVNARVAGGTIKNGFQLTKAVGSPTSLQGEFLGGGPQLQLTAAHGNVVLEAAQP
ncbi:MAG: hypothetical protein JWN44_4019 [Myxococcales bacterium]|nr:hypothetical protein [Myxococcales bacterium]